MGMMGVAQMDNTTRENKNTTVVLYFAWLLGMLDMHCTGMCFMRMGHTHGILGDFARPNIFIYFRAFQIICSPPATETHTCDT